jgi:hypothetical protein
MHDLTRRDVASGSANNSAVLNYFRSGWDLPCGNFESDGNGISCRQRPIANVVSLLRRNRRGHGEHIVIRVETNEAWLGRHGEVND